MPFNLQVFKTRTLTAIIFAAVMLIGLLWNQWAFIALFTIIHFGCWIEYLRLIESIYKTGVDNFTKWYFAFCGFILMLIIGLKNFTINIYWTSLNVNIKWIFWSLLTLGLITFIFQNKKINTQTKLHSFVGFIYITMPILMLLYLAITVIIPTAGVNPQTIVKYEFIYPCTIIFSIWINDTMAYIVGSLIGKTPFSKISPKKTWEGTIGGALLCVVVIATIAYFTKYLLVKDAAIIAVLAAVFGTLGDLFESKLKRMAGVKDSGSFMPGHGGFLDRFDSLLFAVPAVFIYLLLQ